MRRTGVALIDVPRAKRLPLLRELVPAVRPIAVHDTCGALLAGRYHQYV
jgi:hypothetical protein